MIFPKVEKIGCFRVFEFINIIAEFDDIVKTFESRKALIVLSPGWNSQCDSAMLGDLGLKILEEIEEELLGVLFEAF